MTPDRHTLWNNGHDESVEVNQRALIDKVLSRYSGEFTVFRELLQNSDDAQSKIVEIHFETENYKNRKDALKESPKGDDSSLPNLRTTIVHKWIFKNNGIIFRDEDWNRLKKIAEGNPDEEKIGAFGVGFYSLFSVTEEPFVTSGDRWMGFYWKDKKDQLFARRGHLPDSSSESPLWTTFEMDLREPAPIPVPYDFTRFLVSSITFMNHLSEVSLYLDDKCLSRLTKSTGISKLLGLPDGLRKVTRSGIMSVKGITSTPLHIQAEVMQWVYSSGTEKLRLPIHPKPVKSHSQGGFFSSIFSSLAGSGTPQRSSTPLPTPSTDISELISINKSSISLSVYSAEVGVSLDKKMISELHRSTKKNPPTKMKYELIYTAKDEYDVSREEEQKHSRVTGSIFQGLRADVEGLGSGRIFIGHATAQTTGIGGHMAARFIPTVERESIDFMDRNVAVWNKELLYVGGYLCRSAYEFELNTIKALWDGAYDSASPVSGPIQELQSLLTNRALHALKFFTCYHSTPSADVSNLLEESFFSCAQRNQFRMISTKGICDASEIRLPDPAFSGFIKNLPTLPQDIISNARTMMENLQNRGLIKEITFEDVLQELRSRPLDEGEMVACLQWWTSLYKPEDEVRLSPVRTQLLNAAVLVIGNPGSKDEKIIPLRTIKTIINPRTSAGLIPLDGPLPMHLLPPRISKQLPADSVISSMLWTELTIPKWLGHICTNCENVEYDISISASWAERVLQVLIRTWSNLPGTAKQDIITLVKGKPCIPTSGGMKMPDQAYFDNANIFHDLPVVKFPSNTPIKGASEKVLQALGVRKHVDLQVIFNRMIKTNEWTIADLTKYLVSVKSTLTAEEMERLRLTAAFPKEPGPHEIADDKITRYKARDLYEPLDVFRQLGLPLIEWGKQTKWRGSSEEAKLLYGLGLQRYPPLHVLVNDLCASQNEHIRLHGLKYLIDNIGERYQKFNPEDFNQTAFIPALNGTQQCLAKPREVFSNADWAQFGYLIVHPTIRHHASKLMIRENPTTSQLTTLLETKPPGDLSQARVWFSMLSGRVHDFSATELKHLSQVTLVPVERESIAVGPMLRWLPPAQCYLGSDNPNTFHSKLFVFVDFGTAANAFLIACGTRQEPSVEEISKMLLQDPHRFYELAQGPTNFLNEIRNIAVNSKVISPGTVLRMKKSAILLGSQRKPKAVEKSSFDDYNDDEWETIYDLKRPDQIIVADDTHAYQTFGDSLFTAPQEDILEAFYIELGSRRLSSLVKEEYQTSVEVLNSKAAEDTRALILGRLPLFLHEHTHARTRVSYNWLCSSANFVVKTFGKLVVTKSLTFGDLRLSRKQDASAVAKRFGYGPIQLWLAGNAQVDMYEVAMSLNRLIFESPKTNDALLFMTILSTDLRALKRRGYNVDRILRQQKAEQKAVQKTHVDDHGTVLATKPETRLSPPLPPKPEYTGDVTTEAKSSNSSAVENTETQTIPGSFPSSSLQNLRRKIANPFNIIQEKMSGPPWVENAQSEVSSFPSLPSSGQSRGSAVTPLSNISNNIDMAIRACRPESGDLLRNREEMRQVKESLNEGYCDISGRTGNLNLLGTMGNVKVFASGEVPTQEAQTLLQNKHDSIARFIHIMTTLASIYHLPLISLHIFYDIEGGLIAFNRNGSIFLNLRYYEAWHDADVRDRHFRQAFVSWYFTLAHEIAHNLVQPHNSEHEFYFSAICEKYVVELGRLLQ